MEASKIQHDNVTNSICLRLQNTIKMLNDVECYADELAKNQNNLQSELNIIMKNRMNYAFLCVTNALKQLNDNKMFFSLEEIQNYEKILNESIAYCNSNYPDMHILPSHAKIQIHIQDLLDTVPEPEYCDRGIN